MCIEVYNRRAGLCYRYVYKWVQLISNVKYPTRVTKEFSCFELIAWRNGSVTNTQRLLAHCSCAYHSHTYTMMDTFVKEHYFS